MKKVLVLIHDLGQGGAEKVLLNLVSHMNRKLFDISVVALFGGGVNEQFLPSDIKYRYIFSRQVPGNSHIMKLFSPKQLHSMFIKEHYDIEIAYLEGPSARVISGCNDPNTKCVSWIHCTMRSSKDIAGSFRNLDEAENSYNKMNRIVFVSEGVKHAFLDNCNYQGETSVLYNTIESKRIQSMAKDEVTGLVDNKTKLVAVGTLKEVKGFERLLRILKRLKDEKYSVCLYLLGRGPLKKSLEQYIVANSLEDSVALLGYQTNPYKFVSKCDLFVCSSYAEGFSTSTTEALIVGTPVCTVEVSGMKEMLGENNEYGIVTENNEESLYQGIKRLLDNPDLLVHYKKQAEIRGKMFSTENTVKAVEEMLLSL